MVLGGFWSSQPIVRRIAWSRRTTSLYPVRHGSASSLRRNAAPHYLLATNAPACALSATQPLLRTSSSAARSFPAIQVPTNSAHRKCCKFFPLLVLMSPSVRWHERCSPHTRGVLARRPNCQEAIHRASHPVIRFSNGKKRWSLIGRDGFILAFDQ